MTNKIDRVLVMKFGEKNGEEDFTRFFPRFGISISLLNLNG